MGKITSTTAGSIGLLDPPDAVVAVLEPVQQRHAELARDPGHVADVYARGAERARAVTEPVLATAVAAMGL